MKESAENRCRALALLQWCTKGTGGGWGGPDQWSGGRGARADPVHRPNGPFPSPLHTNSHVKFPRPRTLGLVKWETQNGRRGPDRTRLQEHSDIFSTTTTDRGRLTRTFPPATRESFQTVVPFLSALPGVRGG